MGRRLRPREAARTGECRVPERRLAAVTDRRAGCDDAFLTILYYVGEAMDWKQVAILLGVANRADEVIGLRTVGAGPEMPPDVWVRLVCRDETGLTFFVDIRRQIILTLWAGRIEGRWRCLQQMSHEEQQRPAADWARGNMVEDGPGRLGAGARLLERVDQFADIWASIIVHSETLLGYALWQNYSCWCLGNLTIIGTQTGQFVRIDDTERFARLRSQLRHPRPRASPD